MCVFQFEMYKAADYRKTLLDDEAKAQKLISVKRTTSTWNAQTSDFHSNLFVSWELVTEGCKGRPVKCAHFGRPLPDMVILWFYLLNIMLRIKETHVHEKRNFIPVQFTLISIIKCHLLFIDSTLWQWLNLYSHIAWLSLRHLSFFLKFKLSCQFCLIFLPNSVKIKNHLKISKYQRSKF